ncbi:hypothetical protein K7X08_004907 [Anisodus acutangulus]|uniref:Uncharacterized protein n=1 Tax=Anisodus acutangulus TaxID=402998 RepID=A0A9Q1MHE5_9SOLA|nr:hypothetical protein K7X08_004907 [Anisodus acutangulus]
MSGTPTATPSPIMSHKTTSSAPLGGTSGREESSSNSDEEPPQRGGPPQLETYDQYGRLIIEPVGFTFFLGKTTKSISKIVKGLYRGAIAS